MELLKLTKSEFNQIAKLVYDRSGIYLPDTKLTLLSNRLRKRLRVLDLASFQEYHKLLLNAKACAEELPHFLSAVTTNETYFFRNEKLWTFFRKTWIPGIVEHKQENQSIRIWSAASSSGEEAYTAAICLLEDLPQPKTWRISIIGTDISDRVLSLAREGLYNDYAISKMPVPTLKRWFDKEGDRYRLKSELRKVVSFRAHNLRDPLPNGNFDLIFLRNVLMYFDLPMKTRALQNIQDALVRGGHLVVGDVDPIRNDAKLSATMKLEYKGPNLYYKPTVNEMAATAC